MADVLLLLLFEVKETVGILTNLKRSSQVPENKSELWKVKESSRE